MSDGPSLRVLSYNVHRWGDDRDGAGSRGAGLRAGRDAGPGSADLVGDPDASGGRWRRPSACGTSRPPPATRSWLPTASISTEPCTGGFGGRSSAGACASSRPSCPAVPSAVGTSLGRVESPLVGLPSRPAHPRPSARARAGPEGLQVVHTPYLLVGDLNEEPDGPVWNRLAAGGPDRPRRRRRPDLPLRQSRSNASTAHTCHRGCRTGHPARPLEASPAPTSPRAPTTSRC